MFDLLDKLLSVYLAWLWFQIFMIFAGIAGLYFLIMWATS
jgi:uncharacterized membrane protein YuzA (DUF378 family)